MNNFRASLLAVFLAANVAPLSANAFDGRALVSAAGKIAQSVAGGTETAPGTGRIEIAFSPKGGAEELVIKAIESARSDIKVMAYAFTSARITEALVKATRRGVPVAMAVDADHNLSRGSGDANKGRAALSALATAGVSVRVVSAFPIHHDKLIIIDGRHVQSGSFNYTASAQLRNSEYVMVNWDNPALAQAMLNHFNRNFSLGKPFSPGY